ncbi:MAG: alpha-ketoglutarate-dependent dioxygenase AlkB [Proteobacteria bacterium]|nr:alpha-ketoglutarate-dependent dioxygenase AlkB [Pseudomonadota bacterium]
MSQLSPFLTQPSANAHVAGLAYWPDAFTLAEECLWLPGIETLPFKPFEFHGYLGKRRIVPFGWRYDYSRRALRPSPPIPAFLEPLRTRAAAIAGLDTALLQQALVTEYDAGVTIGWHRDKPIFEDVVALSFLSPCRLRLRRKRGSGWERRAMAIAPRSLYRLSGPARHDWEHSIPPVESKRYSVTFRTFVEGRRP